MARSYAALAFAVVSSLIVLPVIEARAQTSPLARPPTVDRLQNGLTVVTVPFDSPGIMAYFTLVRVGSRDEVEPGYSGFAHLFEHMMFRGTARMSGDEYEARVASYGADNNAFTTDDYTMYTVVAPSAVLDGIVELEADRFQNLQFDDATYRTETRAVLGEYNKSASHPFLRMHETLVETAFRTHTYSHTTLGYLRDIQRMPEEHAYSQRFFRRYYTPDNCTLFVVGDVDRARLLRLVRRHYGSWSGQRDTPAIPAEPDPSAPARRDLVWSGTTPRRMMLGYRIPGFSVASPDSAAIEVVHALVFGQSADLYQRLVVREQKLIEMSSWTNDFHRDPYLAVAEMTLRETTSFDEIIDAISAEMARIGRGEIPASRIDEVRSHLRYQLSMSLETPGDVAQLLGQLVAATGELTALDEYVRRLETLTPEDVARVARTYLTDRRRTVVTMAPGAAPETTPEPPPGDAGAPATELDGSADAMVADAGRARRARRAGAQ